MSEPEQLDLRGLKCPLPVLRTKKHLRNLATGQLVSVETSDPLAVVDIPHFCTSEGHRLISSASTAEGHRFIIEKDGIATAVSGRGATGAA